MPEQQPPPQQAATPQSTNPTFKRDEDFEALYANSAIAESSVWDLKIIFGILDQSVQPNQVIQHTSINLPWTQVKLMLYFANLHLAVHESLNGKVSIPLTVRPPDPDTLANALPGVSPELKATLKKLHQDFMATV